MDHFDGDLTALINQVGGEVLENFAFMFTDMDDELVKVSGPYLKAVIVYDNGEVQGEVWTAASSAFCKVLAANVLGLDDDEVDGAAGNDAISELTNVVTGSLLPHLYGDRAVFDLSVPQVSELSVAMWEQHASNHEAVMLSVEGYEVLFGVLTQGR